ncbi:MAG: hypothetical protein ACD_69C00362G0003 [uncultured bacterium]|nr:MAG: hypothetical protein ACD_69C00362G0003 [uncultured bacterium]HBY55403.1 hypothetical protein [Coxiellaceae bacterium]
MENTATSGITKSHVLFLVGEDHSPDTHIISRAGWLRVAKSLVENKKSDKVNVLRMLEESPKKAKQRQLRGYSAVIGFDDAKVISNAYRSILENVFEFIPGCFTERQKVRQALLQFVGKSKNDLVNIKTIISEMDLRDLRLFFGSKSGLLEAWLNKRSKTARDDIIRKFSRDVLLNLSFTDSDIQKKLALWEKFGLSDELSLMVNASIEGRASVRQRENSGWARQIRKMGETYNIDVVVVFVGMSHIESSKGLNDDKKEVNF